RTAKLPAQSIHRQLRRLSQRKRGAERATGGGLQEPAARNRPSAKIRRPLRRQGLHGLTRKIEGKTNRAPRGGGRRGAPGRTETNPLQISAAAALRPEGDDARTCTAGVRKPCRLSR